VAPGAKADWTATRDAGTVSPRRTHFVDITSLSAASLDQLVNQINNSGVTTIVVYTADDTQPVAGSGAASVVDYLSGSVNRLAVYPDTTLRTLNTSGIAGIFSSTPA
jgi:hypothetical protein